MSLEELIAWWLGNKSQNYQSRLHHKMLEKVNALLSITEELCVEKKYKREGPRNFTMCNKGITYCFTSRQWKNLQGQTHCYSQHNYIIFLVKVLDQLPWRAFPSNHENTGSSLLLYRLHACNTLIKNA